MLISRDYDSTFRC